MTTTAASSLLSFPSAPSSSSSSSWFMLIVPSSWDEEYHRMKEMTAEELTSSSSFETTLFVPQEHIWGELIPHSMYMINVITMVFVLSAFLLRNAFPQKETKFIYEASYLITTLCGNLVLGLLGTFFFLTIMERPAPSLDRMVLGYRSSVYMLSCLQMAKNLWSIPIGLTIIHERWEMMAHHIACVLVVGMASSMTMGFTYFAPVVFGMLELSSVPLAIMTFFKLNPEYTELYPATYATIRLLFGISFLTVRWGLAVPYLCTMLRLIAFRIHTLVYYHYTTSFHNHNNDDDDHHHDSEESKIQITTVTTIITILLSLTWLATFFLTVLQGHWGFLILKGIIKSIVPSSSSSSSRSSPRSMDQLKKKC